MTHHEGRLYVFGGIHDITWELDDLHIYDLKSNRWTTLEQDSPRKIERKKENNSDVQEEKNEGKSSKKKNWYETLGSGMSNKPSNNPSSPGRNFSITYNEEGLNKNESPGKMLDEQRKKVFYQKKAEMLKNF